jgi:hypothetical protein
VHTLGLGPGLLAEIVEVVKQQIHIFVVIAYQVPLHLRVVLYFYFCYSGKFRMLGF